MTVTAQLLSALVDAHENSQKFSALRSELISQAMKEGVTTKAYRFREYNIHVEPIPFRGPQLTIERAQDLTPRPKPDATCETVGHSGIRAAKEELRPGTICFAYHGDPNVALKVPGNVNPDEREAAVEALHTLSAKFHWHSSSRGRKFWVDLTNQLRSVAGWSHVPY